MNMGNYAHIGTFLEDHEDPEIRKLTPKAARAMIEEAINEAGYIADTSGNAGRRIAPTLADRARFKMAVARAVRNAQQR